MRVRRPDIQELRRRCEQGTAILISAPFYSQEGLNWVRPISGGRVEFWTRFNPRDWAAGVADPPALLRRRWNGVRKYLHSFSVIEDLLGSARGRSTELLQSVVMCEPSSFTLSERGDFVTFRGPPLPLHKCTSGPSHKERTGQPSQVSIWSI